MIEIFPLAEAATHFTADQVGALLVAVIVALGGGGLLGRAVGKKEAQSTRLEEPVPTVPTRKVPGFVTWNDLNPLIQRMDRFELHLDKVRDEQGKQFKDLLEAGQERELRLSEANKESERLLADKMDGIAREWHARLDDQFGPRPQRRGTKG